MNMRLAGWTPRIAGLTEDTSAVGILEKISLKGIPASAKKIGEPTIYWTTRDDFDFPDPESERRRLNRPQAEICLERRMAGATHYAVREINESDDVCKEVYLQGERARGYAVEFYKVE